VGNALEVKEAINTLQGRGPKDLFELCLTLGSNMVYLAGKANTVEEARTLLLETVKNGSAINKLKEFVAAQGGNPAQVDNPDLLPKAKYIVPVISDREGCVKKINAENIGLAAMKLGAGRAAKEDKIDLAVGIVLNKKRGDCIKLGEVIAYIHANDEGKIENAKRDILENYIIDVESGRDVPLIFGTIGG
ncbi:MAG: pyrimidine-nucleoside phosphorylase, partial [Bacillota bacterium]|nr:pyrimidine-nucleoside phosphorylase [Bacillota bacterium]